MPYATANGIRVYFEEAGEGPVVLIAHGALGCVKLMQPGMRPVDLAPAGFRVIAYDARAHGKSGFSRNPEDYRVEARADDLSALMDALHIDRASIVGSSMGASTALAVAYRAPERVSRLVLRSPPPFPPDDEQARRKLTSLASAYAWLGAPLTARLAATSIPPQQRDRLRVLFAAQRRRAVVPMLKGVLRTPFSIERLNGVKASTLVVAHPGDSSHPTAAAETLCARLSTAQMQLAQSRYFWEEHPDHLTKAIVDFLRGD